MNPTTKVEDLVALLREQDFVVEMTPGGHWKAVPPNKTGRVVHFSKRLNDPAAFKNTVSHLRKSGFVYEPDRKKIPHLYVLPNKDAPSQEAPIESEPVSLNTPPEHFSSALRRLRKAEGLEVQAVAGLLNVTRSAVDQWELGYSTPIKSHYEMLLDLFPDLSFVEEPDVRDIRKPDGNLGNTYSHGPRDASPELPAPVESTTQPTSSPESEPLMNMPASNGAPPAAPPSPALITKFVKLALQVRETENTPILELLMEAHNAGMTLENVLEIIT